MEIWITCDKGGFQLPILPPSFEVSTENSHGTLNIQTKGDVTILGKGGLKTVTLSSFFPGQDYHFAAYSKDREPYDYINSLEKWSEKVVLLTITDTNICMECVIQSLTYGEPDGSGDVEYSVTLQEYRVTKGGSGILSQVGSAMPTFKPIKDTPKKDKVVHMGKYTVKKGDTLRSISKKYYGTGSKHKKIYDANKKVIERAAKKHGKKSSTRKGVKGGWIFPGTKLVIP